MWLQQVASKWQARPLRAPSGELEKRATPHPIHPLGKPIGATVVWALLLWFCREPLRLNDDEARRAMPRGYTIATSSVAAVGISGFTTKVR